MGRHRRNGTAGAAADRAAAAAGPTSSDALAVGEVSPEHPHRGAHRHRRRGVASVRTGLLGASAAVAVGAIAVTSGMLPGGSSYSVGGGSGGGSSDQVRSVGTPSGLETLGGTEGPSGGATTHPGAQRSTGAASGQPSASGAAGSPSAHAPSAKTAHPAPHTTATAGSSTPKSTQGTITKTPSDPPSTTAGEPTLSAESAAAQEVLALVNKERGTAGCSPLSSDDALTDLARAFSEQMADEGFFDHTDPAGLSPWDRAAKVGITDLGGENIARGQADAAAVMDAWMNSAGHRANILNCDYKTIGIGVHFGAGGPWWTQDFGL